ncbi:hypothetical protein JCM31598_00430 [Desulfonatronum parangueonense]
MYTEFTRENVARGYDTNTVLNDMHAITFFIHENLMPLTGINILLKVCLLEVYYASNHCH